MKTLLQFIRFWIPRLARKLKGKQVMPSQAQMYYAAEKNAAEVNQLFLDLVNHPTNPLTRADLARNIERRPALWSRFAGWLSKLPAD